MSSFFAYANKTDTDTYYRKMDMEFYREHFSTIFSNPIGNDWNIMSQYAENKLSHNAELIKTYYPNGYCKPLQSCRLSSLASDYGVYLASTIGENVLSPVNGTIYEIKTDERYGGTYVMIDNGISKTIIGGLETVTVEVDATVNMGDVIGTAKGEEIFFGLVNENFVSVDPLFLLQTMGDVNAKYPSFGPCLTMPIFKQYDTAIADYPYGTSTISRSGCGVCAFSMILSQINGVEQSPTQTTDALNIIATQRGENYTFYYIPEYGSTWDCWGPLAEYYGLKFISTDNLTAENFKNLLDQGYYLMISIKANAYSPYQGTGHYIVIRGYDEYGFYVNDSNVGDEAYNPDIPYSYEQLVGIKMARAIGPSDAGSSELPPIEDPHPQNDPNNVQQMTE
jgi:hypothetical protein